jgi:hypothetical protein
MPSLPVVLALGFALRLNEAPPAFTGDVSAVLSRAGCNMGACHGNLTGKGGFKLSLRGFDPGFDHVCLTRDVLGRRINPHRPDDSLILQKATGRVPHEGGVRFAADSPEYRVLRAWVAAGAPFTDTPAPTKLTVVATLPEPGTRNPEPDLILFAPADRVKLTAVAHLADGRTRDVTRLAAFETTALGVAKVLPTGEVVKEGTGETVVLVRYLGAQAAVRLAFLPARPAVDLSGTPTPHPIDRHVFDQLTKLRIEPSAVCEDQVFVRRAYLDACGITPTAAEVRAFLADPDPDKRAKLIDALLARPEFAGYWAQKWSDLLRNEEKSLDRKGVNVFHRWIKDWLAADKPLTEFAAEILAGRGSTYSSPASNFYRAVRDPYTRAEAAAQVFLGLRVSCAKCHNHPFDVWTQDDYHRFAAVFARVDYRVLSNDRKDNLDKHEFVGEQVVYQKADGELPHPRGGTAAPKFLGADTPALGGRADRLGAVAGWVAGPANPFFARAQANRVWLHLFGRGLVDPNDDFRATNPPTNPALLDHLTAEFARGGYRLKPLVRHVMTSRTYQLSAAPTATNADDDTHFSRALVQPLEAEQLCDALSRVFGVPVKFPGYPTGTRAGEVPATPQAGRRQADGMGPRFLKVFGKPDRLLTCECERSEDPGVLQAFQLLTGELVHSLLRSPDNRLGAMLGEGKSDAAMLDELYLSAVARFPTSAEREKLLAYVGDAKDRRAAWEDIAWGLVNAKEFLLRR